MLKRVFALFCLLMAPLAFVAAQAPAPAAAPASIFAPVTMNGQTLFEVGGPDAATRAQRINARLQTLVTRASDVTSFEVQKQGGSYILVVGNIPVMTVTDADAQDQLQEPQTLAQTWGKLLTKAVQDARAEQRSWSRRILNPVYRSFDQILDGALAAGPRLLGALILILFTFYGARLVRALITPLARRIHIDANLQQLFASAFYYGSWLLGLLAMASVLGFSASSLIAALGVSGFVIGFAFQDILSHFLAGIILLAGRTFQIGDQITVNAYEGTVEEINLRATFLRTYDHRLVIIPNADVFTTAVVNNTQSPARRQEFDIKIVNVKDIAQAQIVAYRTLSGTEGVLEKPAPDVLVADVGPDGVTLRCRFSTDSRRRNVLAVGSEARRRVKEAFDCEGYYAAPATPSSKPPEAEPPSSVGEATAPENAVAEGRSATRREEASSAAPKSSSEEKESQAKAAVALPQEATAEST
jgi:small-conductance mechanosensitive channel